MNAVGFVFRSGKNLICWLFSVPAPNFRQIMYHGSAWGVVAGGALLSLLLAHG